MSLLHAGYPQQPHHQASPVIVASQVMRTNSGVGGGYHLQHDGNIGGGQGHHHHPHHMRGSGVMIGGAPRRVSNASSNGSFENMSRPAYQGRDTDRFFGGEFEMDEDEDDVGGMVEKAPRRNELYDFEDDVEDEDEPVSELVPLGGGTRRVPRTPRRKSTSTCGFYDFYRLTDEHLGAGAYGSVTTCTALATGLEYAVKIVDKSGETHSRQRILREVNIFKVCKNQPNIVQLVDWFEDDYNFYLVMEKMRGGPLLQHILKRGYFTEEEARRVTKDIAQALKFMHDRGIAHRDVKPENVLCTDPDMVSPVKLCDLDLASQRQPGDRHERASSLSQVASEPDLASPVGSAEFMAPEVVDAFVGDSLKYDKKCDTWSLGVILYIMLAGYAPFQGECDDDACGWSDGQPCDDCQQELFHRIQKGYFDFPVEEWGMISAEAKDLVSKLLKRDPTERYNADDILKHPWLQQSAPPTILQTPSNLIYRKDSARDVQQMSEHFNVMNRFVAARLSARMDQLNLNDENGGAVATINNGSFLFVGTGNGIGGEGGMTLPLNIDNSKSTDFTPPTSRASPTTPPPSMIINSMFTPQTDRNCLINTAASAIQPLSPLYFGSDDSHLEDTSIQLFGTGTNVVTGNSVQMTPRMTTEDEASVESFESSSPEFEEKSIRIETKVNV